jgi:hypothetical protein
MQPKGLQGKQIEDHRLTVGPDGACFVYALYTTEPSGVTSRRVHGTWYARFASEMGSVATDRAEASAPRHGRRLERRAHRGKRRQGLRR